MLDTGKVRVCSVVNTDRHRNVYGSVISRLRAGIPQTAGKMIWSLEVVREASGAFIAELHVEETGPKLSGSLAYYAWSSETKSWSPVNPDPCRHHRLAGTGGDNLIYLYFARTASTICSYSRP